MTTQDDGGPAFPSVSVGTTQHGDKVAVGRDFQGLSLRDYFAGQALAGLLASKMEAPRGFTAAQMREAAALNAYDFADAMLRARGGE